MNDKFQTLPEKVKEWLSSMEAFYSTEEIIEKFGIEYEKETVIPELVFRLCTKELDPLDFIYELSQKLGIDFNQAKTISEEVEEKILKPVKLELRADADVDIKQIYLGKPGARAVQEKEPVSFIQPPAMPSAIPHPIQKSFRDFIPRKPGETPPAPTPAAPAPKTPSEKTVEPTVNLETFEIKHTNSAPPPAAPEIRTRPRELVEPVESAAPFILHQESQTPATGPSASKFSTKPGLNIKIQDYQSRQEQKKSPVPVKIETPMADDKTTNAALRVVHYNGLRTPLTNSGFAKKADENTVDLRKFSKPENK